VINSDTVEYIDAAVRTEKVPHFEVRQEVYVSGDHRFALASFPGITGELKMRLLHSALGMMTEIVELQAALRKCDWVNVAEEVGDVFWYWAVAMRACGFTSMPARAPSTSFMRNEARTGEPLIAAICEWGDLVRRDAIHAKPPKPEDVAQRLFDVYDEACTLCEAVEIDPLQVMRRNIAKLRVRFPEKYDGVRFDQRDLEEERRVLERADDK